MSKRLQAKFLDVADRRIFSLEFLPPPGVATIGTIVILPPFAEEMNRARRYITHLAQRLSDSGNRVLHIDLSNTGDSSGTFAHARVDNWIDDLSTACKLFGDNDAEIHLLGIRSGALMIPSIVSNEGLTVDKVAVIEPIASGREMLNEFLRLRVARSVFEGQKESVSSLATILEQGEDLEVAGYTLSSNLYDQLLTLSLDEQQFQLKSPGLAIGCLRSLSEARVRKFTDLVKSWRCSEPGFSALAINVEPFWANELVTVSDALDSAILTYFAHA